VLTGRNIKIYDNHFGSGGPKRHLRFAYL
jgi:hypothetical protein